MVFNRTSCVKKFRAGGFTLVEYVVATSIGLLVLAVALLLWGYANRTCASLMAYVELSAASKNALDRVSQQVRNAKHVQSCSRNKLVLLMPATGSDVSTLTYAYDAATKTLKQTIVHANMQQETATLLTGCTDFEFSVFQRTPMSNSFQLYTNGWSTNTAKVVQMRWKCARKLTGDKNNVETQIAAKVVIRNQ